ncbi:CDK2- associated dual specificity phosphatase, putative [Ixodes scapularis]|uniref:protein-tyrosine-phosphatase n=1 Tax=Ixodes scapularis TaxID=6945 RepID=B7PP47_IXOSC|nr:CDK2- associated dual specificity phosphatase, putative [Ixodes scapularis]|eukprot:XP_002435539.1 CDK2- associated dual specificity phosphatase, putative [Ixodes scapularis]
MDSSDEEVSGDYLKPATPLKIDWLDLSMFGYPDSVGLSGLPGCKFKDSWRDTAHDLEYLKLEDVSDVFVLCTRGELTLYRVPSLLTEYESHGITVHHHPFQDGTAPGIEQVLNILKEIGKVIEQGKRALVHCFGGLGRTGVVAACLLLNLDDGVTPEYVVRKVQELRGTRAIQTVKQYNFIHDFRSLRDMYLGDSDSKLATE